MSPSKEQAEQQLHRDLGRENAERYSSPSAAQGPLRLAYSPCPNDTFIFHAWVRGLVSGVPAVSERLEDIDTLNLLASQGRADVIKVSAYAFAYLRDRYALLHSGGAMGRGCGPLVVAPKDSRLRPLLSAHHQGALGDELGDELARAQVAIPGPLTTAALLVELFTGGLKQPVVMPFDRIMPAIVAGEVDAGVIIHEGRFTFDSYGLRCLVDLGGWWEEKTGLPIPLGGIAVSRSLPRDTQAQVEKAVRASVEHAWADPEATMEYVLQHCQELDPAVCQQHIDLYVNDFTLDYGSEGEAALRRLLGAVSGVGAGLNNQAGTLRAAGRGLFWDD